MGKLLKHKENKTDKNRDSKYKRKTNASPLSLSNAMSLNMVPSLLIRVASAPDMRDAETVSAPMNAAICAHDETHPWSVFKSALCTMLPTEGAEAQLFCFPVLHNHTTTLAVVAPCVPYIAT